MIREEIVERDALGMIKKITRKILSPDEELAFDAFQTLKRRVAEASDTEEGTTLTIDVDDSADRSRIYSCLMARLTADRELCHKVSRRPFRVNFVRSNDGESGTNT